MKKNSTQTDKATHLRKRAEKLLAKRGKAEKKPLKQQDLQRLVHELQVHQIELELQNEELLEARNEIETLLATYTDLYDFAPIGYVTVDHTGVIREANLSAAGLLEVNRARLLGMRFNSFIEKKARPAFDAFLAEVLRGDEKKMHEIPLLTERSRPLFVRIEALASVPGQQCRMVIIDITEKKHDEELIRESLREKEVLLKELHHRTKNNMQVISSLLSIQALKLHDASLRAVFADMQSRISSIALVHEMLYMSENLHSIDFGEYIHALAQSMLSSSQTTANSLSLSFDTDRVMLPIKSAVPCGIVINELLANIFKHAFPGERSGTITISFHVTGGGKIYLAVRDDGVGMPDKYAKKSTGSMGLMLVRNIVEQQLGGTLEVQTGKGTQFTIIFFDTASKQA